MREETPEALIRNNTLLSSPPLLPELRLYLATEVTPLWRVTESWLSQKGIEPPFWAFAWAGGQAITRFLLDRPEIVRGKTVLDIASGSGLCGLGASRAGAKRVICVDRDPLAKVAAEMNAAENGLLLSAFSEDILADLVLPAWALGASVILAGDVCYDAAMTRLFWPWLLQRAREGALVLLGDPGRAYLPKEQLLEVARYRVPTLDDVEAAGEKWGVVYQVVLGQEALVV